MTTPHENRVLSHLFDIRNIIGALLAIYGVVLTIAGFAPAVLRDHDDPAAAATAPTSTSAPTPTGGSDWSCWPWRPGSSSGRWFVR